MKLAGYLRAFVIFNMLIAIVPLVLQVFFSSQQLLIPYFWLIYGLSALLNLSVYLVSYWGMLTSDKATVKTFLGGTSIKFLLWMIIVFIYLFNITVDGTKFITNFFYLYLLHSVFEILCLLRNLRNQNLK
ncbi:hypothetical protein SAMN05216464_106134 [Mucilaginibacter pineti]|uniref:ATP synthase protein I n=2 Tax=Mucilaginibacter pineti TaxID=1391627 RepID=A0A1G7CZA2_9SPHI|nr:hypothetical protein SAMN05216464_106134 [Mucilaginibacter pineti]